MILLVVIAGNDVCDVVFVDILLVGVAEKLFE
jgi:hypothetical protein